MNEVNDVLKKKRAIYFIAFYNVEQIFDMATIIKVKYIGTKSRLSF